MTDDRAVLTVPARYAGPPGIGNGGYVSGRIAAHLAGGGPVRVTLRQPPPLEVPLLVAGGPDRVTVTFGGSVVAEAEPGTLTLGPVEPVSFDVATAVMNRYAGLGQHPFPGCFVCGTDRPAPDGLGLRPGRLDGRTDSVATAWVPEASLADASGGLLPEMVWAALDCPGGWSADLVGRPMVLGRITAAVDALPEVGERCVVMGRLVGGEGRKTFTLSTAYDGDGRILGRAEAVWFAVDPARLGGT